jgi:chromosome segregation ATPase
MPRGRRRVVDATALEQELEQLKQRQAELRAQLRQLKRGSGGVRKLEEKLERQLATAKWTVGLIKELQPEWDELGFYEGVKARQPTPRGPRRRRATE